MLSGYVNSGDVKVNPEGEEGDEDGDSSDKDDDSEELLLSELGS